MNNDPHLAVAIRSAHRAASVIVDAARDLRRRPVHAKGTDDFAVQTEAEAENAIVSTIRAAFPNHAIMGDEARQIVSEIASGANQGGGRFKWIVDPIDGVANFLHGYPGYAVSIALTQADEVTHAVVFDPVRDELYAAIKGKGAVQNGTAIHTSTCMRLDEALVGTVFPSRSNPKLSRYLHILGGLVTQCGGLRRSGSCSLDLAYVAAGRLDGFWVTSLTHWDILAGMLIVDEAGGRIGDFAGGREFLRTNEVIAAAPGVFSPLREAIAGSAPRL